MRNQKISPRLKCLPNGMSVLSGIPYDALHSILTAARLHYYDHPFKPQPLDGHLDEIVTRNNKSSEEWCRRQEYILDEIQRREDAAHRAKWAPKETLKQRLKRRNKDRQHIKKIMAEVFGK